MLRADKYGGSMFRIILSVLSLLNRRKLVYLKDMWGETYLTWAKKDPWGKWSAPVYPITGVGLVFLSDDGTCYGSSSYITEWKWV